MHTEPQADGRALPAAITGRRDGWLPVSATLGLVLAFALAAPQPTPAQAKRGGPATLEVAILDPGRLRVGATGSLTVVVRGADTQARPLLLSPTVQGAALEVVRGRLLRSDATTAAPDHTALRFAVPVRAAAAGTSVVDVTVATYTCAARCRQVTASARLVVRTGG